MGRSHGVQLPGLTLRRFSSLLVTSPRGLLIFLRQAAQKPSFDQLELSEVTQPSATQVSLAAVPGRCFKPFTYVRGMRNK